MLAILTPGIQVRALEGLFPCGYRRASGCIKRAQEGTTADAPGEQARAIHRDEALNPTRGGWGGCTTEQEDTGLAARTRDHVQGDCRGVRGRARSALGADEPGARALAASFLASLQPYQKNIGGHHWTYTRSSTSEPSRLPLCAEDPEIPTREDEQVPGEYSKIMGPLCAWLTKLQKS